MLVNNSVLADIGIKDFKIGKKDGMWKVLGCGKVKNDRDNLSVTESVSLMRTRLWDDVIPSAVMCMI